MSFGNRCNYAIDGNGEGGIALKDLVESNTFYANEIIKVEREVFYDEQNGIEETVVAIHLNDGSVKSFSHEREM